MNKETFIGDKHDGAETIVDRGLHNAHMERIAKSLQEAKEGKTVAADWFMGDSCTCDCDWCTVTECTPCNHHGKKKA